MTDTTTTVTTESDKWIPVANLQEYQQLALRTESIVEKLQFNPAFVLALFKLFALSGQALDGVKKDVYYNKPKKLDEDLLKIFAQMEIALRIAKHEYNNKDNKKEVVINPRVFHGVIGMATEAGELVEALEKGIENDGVIDPVNIHEEIHDSSWYQAILHETLNLDWRQGLENNINKLRKRYPDKFTFENADKRNLEEERKVLEVPAGSFMQETSFTVDPNVKNEFAEMAENDYARLESLAISPPVVEE